MPCNLCLDSTTHPYSWHGFKFASAVFFIQPERKTLTKLLPLDHAALLLTTVLLPESKNSRLKPTADELPKKWHILKKISNLTILHLSHKDEQRNIQAHRLIFQRQCRWLCWSLCVYEVNSRLECQIYHFGCLNQRRRGAYFFLAKIKCLFTELFTFICSQVISRINVSGRVNCEMFLWWACLPV